jgi:anti-sigma B factor antagonist
MPLGRGKAPSPHEHELAPELAWLPQAGYARRLSFIVDIGELDFMQLRMSTRSMNDVLVVDCSGRVVFGEESASLRDTVKKLLAENPKVVMNLREVNHIDSGGLGTLVSLYTTARNAGGAVKLASLSQRVGDLLQVTKLLTIFEVFEDEEAAAKSFK